MSASIIAFADIFRKEKKMADLIWTYMTSLTNLIIPFVTIRFAFDVIRYYLFE